MFSEKAILEFSNAGIDARDRLGRTPLMMTAYSGNTGDDAMTVMLARGADPDGADRSGNTPLHLLASDSGKKDRVKGVLRLIEAGANLELANKGRMTPLMLAVKSKKTEIVKALLSA
jgi:ankyrin repeat protein